MEAPALARKIAEVLSDHGLTADRFADALVRTFVSAGSFVDAQDAWKMVDALVSVWTPERLRVSRTPRTPSLNIRDAYYLPEKVRALIARRPLARSRRFGGSYPRHD
jgi:hypothetical protein